LVEGFPDAKYKSFPTEQEAKEALAKGWEPYYQATPKKQAWKSRDEATEVPFVKESIAVDAACSGNP
jgi:ribonuclease HI